MEGVRFRLRGRVQGVGFRWWTASHARDLALVGSVRNRADGSVEVHVAGAPESIQALRSLLATGPPGAMVTGIDEEPAAFSATDFVIER